MGLGWMVASICNHNDKVLEEKFQRNLRDIRRELSLETERYESNIPYSNPLYMQNVALIDTMQSLIYEMDALMEAIDKNRPTFNINIVCPEADKMMVTDAVKEGIRQADAVKEGIRQAIVYEED